MALQTPESPLMRAHPARPSPQPEATGTPSEAANTEAAADRCLNPGAEASVTSPLGTADWVAREALNALPDMRRVLLTVSYDGTAYAGWQRQANAMTVQQRLEEALFRLTGERVSIMGASRTDAGVHALGQRAHFDTRAAIPADRFPYALNTCLPPDIRVLAGVAVPGTFHARFDAKGKRYCYRIHNARHASALYRNLTAHVPVPLHVERMRAALPDLLGTHDFAAFQASGGTAKTTVRTVRAAALTQTDAEIVLSIQGNAFLYNMVRIIAGTLIEIGKGKLPADCFRRALATGDRLCLGATAPACGLELTEVYYDFPDAR